MTDILSNGIIRMNRGDSFNYPLYINVGDSVNPVRYKLQRNDKVYFAVTEINQSFEDAILKKVYDRTNLNSSNDIEIELTPDDTEHLLAGTYHYEIKIKLGSNDAVCTIVPKRYFYISE